jgi:hypothetical protein
MTETTTEKSAETAQEKPLTVVQQLMRDVSDNPMLVKWPRDRWGTTTALKKEVLAAASTVRGNQDKHDILLNTLAVAIAHIQKRRQKDVRARELSRKGQTEAMADRLPRQRVSAALVPQDPTS